MYNSLREQPVISALVSPAEKLWPKKPDALEPTFYILLTFSTNVQISQG